MKKRKRGIVSWGSLTLLAADNRRGCANSPIADEEETSLKFVYSISASEDTFVSCDHASGCAYGDMNFGPYQELATMSRMKAYSIWDARSFIYLDFALPQFPGGTTVDYFRLELYNTRTFSSPDDLDPELSLSPLTGANREDDYIRWNLNPRGGGTEYGESRPMTLVPDGWSYSADLAAEIQPAIDDPSEFAGFIVGLNHPNHITHRLSAMFYSIDYALRSDGEVDLAPRLLMKVTIPADAGITAENVEDLPLSDVDPPSVPVRIDVLAGTLFPAEWQAAAPE